MQSGIYIIKNKINNYIYYGSTVDFKVRERQHFKNLRKNKHSNQHLQNAFNKYGKENFIFEIIELVEKSKLLEIEQRYLDKYVGTKNRYNIAKDAWSPMSGFTHSKEAREKISKTHLGHKYNLGRKHTDETKEKVRQIRLGTHLSDITKEKLKKIHLGKKLSKEQKEKMSIAHSRNFSLLSPEGMVYCGMNMKKFCKEHNLTPSGVNRVLKGERICHKGWRKLNGS